MEDHPVIMAANVAGSTVAGTLLGANLLGYLPDIASGMAIIIYTAQFCMLMYGFWKWIKKRRKSAD